MRFGIGCFATDEGPNPAELGRLVEERGFESIFFTEHTHIPASRETPWPVGGELPREYARTYDPMVALTAAAGVTDELLLGTAVCLVAQRDPILTAKEVASIDRLSGGRVLFGVGAGWNQEEMRDHGTDPARRFGVMRERVDAMRAIWTQDEASYHGDHVSFDAAWCWPKPVQSPHPPVLVGGNGRGVLDRVLSYGDEWLPNRVGDDEKLLGRVADLSARGEAAGRGPISTTLCNAPVEPELLERYEAAGVHRFVFWLRHGDAVEVERRLDRLAAAVEAL